MENFSKLESERLYVPNATFVKVYKIAGTVTLIVDSGTAFFNKANTPIFNLPEKYRPNETLYFSASYRNSSKSNTFFLYSNGNLIKSEADDNLGAYYFTISYPAKIQFDQYSIIKVLQPCRWISSATPLVPKIPNVLLIFLKKNTASDLTALS